MKLTLQILGSASHFFYPEVGAMRYAGLNQNKGVNRTFVSLGALLAGIGVALGAFGTHSLREKLSGKLLETWQTGVQYHVIHAIALIVVGLVCAHANTKAIRASGWLFVAGILIFGGTLYAYALTETKAFAMITPLGGLCFIVGWFLLAFSVRKG